ncbi:MAG TPA: exodeoxyribonuclease III [Polyangia bacterium]
MPTLRLATFNINNVVSRLPQLLGWLEKAAPDVVCLQELKAVDTAFPIAALKAAGYGAIWKGQKSWNGVAILAKGSTPIPIRRELPGDPSDDQSRYLEAAVFGVIVGCLYLPNGNPQPGPKFQYKLVWFERFLSHAQSLFDSGHPVVLAGDYNVVPTDFDIYNPRSWLKNALLQPESRACYQRLLAQGWLDAIRSRFPDQQVFTFWDYFRDHWKRNAGLRLDHILLSRGLAPKLTDAGVDTWARDMPNASDHAPAWITLALDGKAPPKRARETNDGSRKPASKPKNSPPRRG